ncbi:MULTISPECIES: 30S ribosomal protein S4 [Metallosphaera]|uniref:Small ribosomal subunit protein uS4 n=3 Tax=Metallosphaera TaxID=41980 RepID=RS4_METS5|nr:MULTISPECIES: 30S ribosomal protein S4 [Metallosphaera]A4YIN4.1 RecName: Full=Small ribosomal subunit protein uS4; AltName: Full=30S ribosomal protein S4 [Metallosphaera sedula DSM 5348]ABP96286.1 SSU ribosomal protein S4P [Metallosphaera sedula DSM 5348]AIM28269.1 SSU ribosomal protein S4P [Metallosphaera sedula]AKV75074.1 30S ribosomal protein S4 [Metallosphaera sedula]AKV77313.1 30S ribosomal protein S4 [Metallosphaera sedula]AKV79563.1 30S ribosomal protein S4 [Metallosphaera sedula]
MGDPRKSRRKWEGPGMPWLSQALKSEQKIMGDYGLRNKKEIWLARTIVTGYRHMARSLLALPPAERAVREKQLLGKLYKLGLLKSEQSTIDDILGLEEESLLERRLQTIVHRKGLARTIYQARQLIVHGHIAVGGRKITSPGYIVKRDEEDSIDFYPTSPFKNNPPTAGQGEVNVEQKGN